jgi:SpoU rRNA methylase family enzyme
MRATAAEVVEKSDLIVVGTADPEFEAILKALGPEKTVVDLAHVVADPAALAADYHGVNR